MHSLRTSPYNKSLGFTLIELLITIAIIAILAQVAFASYSSAIQKSKRYEVQQSMIELAQQQERYYSRNGAYSTAISTIDSDDYNVTVAFSSSASTYTISATPNSGSSQDDDECGTLTLNYLGTQTPSSSGCWK